MRTTHHYVKILLSSERIKTNSGERSLLKNLGSFLGQLTIAKNKPVLQKDLDVKAIIVDGYVKGKMIAVIPFVHKVTRSQAPHTLLISTIVRLSPRKAQPERHIAHGCCAHAWTS